MNDPVLDAILATVQVDVGGRGLAHHPDDNLLTRTHGDFAAACQLIAGATRPRVGILTGFFIPHADPPAGETDGPLGALHLVYSLKQLGIDAMIITDPFLQSSLTVGCQFAGVDPSCLRWLPEVPNDLTHLIALERVGPSHRPESISAHPHTQPNDVTDHASRVDAASWGRCHTMGGRDITDIMQPVEHLFGTIPSIGIGDGGNEIGMGKIPWRVIAANIPNGAKVACRVATDFLIVVGVSNWGAYALSAGIAHCRGQVLPRACFDIDREREILSRMVEAGPLVDGVTGRPSVSVDGLSFERYIEPLVQMGHITGALHQS